MLEHAKSHVETMHFIDAEVSGHAHEKLTSNCRGCVGVAFLCLLCTWLPTLTILEWTDRKYFAKTKMGYISLPLILNAIMGITS